MLIFSGLTFTGTPSPAETLGAKRVIANENARITAANVALAAQTPPGTPLPLWPAGTGAEIKASYLALLLQGVANSHISYMQQAVQPEALNDWFTEDSLKIIRSNLITRRQAGATEFELISDTAA